MAALWCPGNSCCQCMRPSVLFAREIANDLLVQWVGDDVSKNVVRMVWRDLLEMSVFEVEIELMARPRRAPLLLPLGIHFHLEHLQMCGIHRSFKDDGAS